jgi:CRISPR-associated protein Csa1
VVYFLEHEDLQLIARRLGPQARSQPVAEDLRGWRWYRPPLSPVFDAPLDVDEVAGMTCATGRDVYLTHVLDVRRRPSPDAVAAEALRAAVGRAVLAAKRALYLHGPAAAGVVAGLEPPALGELLVEESPAPAGLAEQVAALWAWECGRLAARIGEAAAAQPGATADSLVALAAPVTVGRRVDGRFLGLVGRLEADGVLGPALIVTVLRFGPARPADRLVTASGSCGWPRLPQFGPARPADRLVTTGLALALEAAHDVPVELGCVTYGGFVDGHLCVERDLHVIDDELRQQFIEARDEKARLVQEEIDPGLPGACPADCPYGTVCHEGVR